MSRFVLDRACRQAVDHVLDQEERRRRHLVIVLAGAHACGFPSADSDIDVRGVHVVSTELLLGLDPAALHTRRVEGAGPVAVDYASNELLPVLLGVLQGNGFFVERLLGTPVLRSSAQHEELRPLVRDALSRRVHRHYAGAVRRLQEELETAAAPAARIALHALRHALTGARLLRSGEVVLDLGELLDEHPFADARALMELKAASEEAPLPEGSRARWIAELRRALEILDEALDRSCLPAEPQGRAGLEAWVVKLRSSEPPHR